MCGIVGIHSLNHPVDERSLRKAAETLSYRGPDDEGIFLSPGHEIGLAHKRLSIIDLSHDARQPMSDETGRYHIVFNGEIYNFKALRSELEAFGYNFRTHSDTEVLLKAYIHWRNACLSRIEGMFAFCVFDDAEGTLFLARDRMGKKPLYYTQKDGFLVFASEPKAIIATGLVDSGISAEGVNWYFALGYVPGSMTAFEHIKRLLPGHYILYRLHNASLTVDQYWDVPQQGDGQFSENEALNDIEDLLAHAVKSRMVSDVPLGAFLSGGLDSSLVVAMMRAVHNGDILTFSVGFEGSSQNELRYAATVAHHFNTEHTEISVAPRFRDDLEDVSALLDEPVYDSSILPTYYLCRETRRYVTVALSGDGGDELFAGYIHYGDALRTRRIAGYVPRFLKPVARAFASIMPRGVFGKNTLDGIAGDTSAAFIQPTEIFTQEERRRLLTEDVRAAALLESPAEYRTNLLRQRNTFVNAMCYTDMKTLLADDILPKVDRASMFNSLEVRCPFLDRVLAEYTFGRLPDDLKIRGGIKKYLLKRLALRLLPRGLELERKQGFSIPADVIDMSFIGQRLLDFPRNPYINNRELKTLATGPHDARMSRKLFALYFFSRWLEQWAV